MKKKMRCLFAGVLSAGLLISSTALSQIVLSWDSGAAQSGTAVYNHPGSAAGSYLFSITTTNTANNVGYWRSVLAVTAGEADLYTSLSSNLTSSSSTFKSEDPGDDTITQPLTAGETWYILVEAEAGAEWSLFAGDLHVENLTWDPGNERLGTEVLSNTVTEAGSYLYKITTPAGLYNLWRTVLRVEGTEADLYMKKSADVSPDNYTFKSDAPGHDTITQSLTAGETWYILVEAEANTEWRLFAGDLHVENLTWDPGAAQLGTEVLTNQAEEAGSYLYKITTQAGSYDLWRTMLRVESGEADLYMKQNVNVSANSYTLKSDTRLSDAITQPLTAGQTWYILVEAEAGAEWRLFSGDLHVEPLTWDPGAAQLGTAVFDNPITAEGSYYFEVTTEAGSYGLWRSVLMVDSGEADLYLKKNIDVTTNSYTLVATNLLSDTIVQPLAVNETWYLLVNAQEGAEWSLFAGDIHMMDMTWDPGTADRGTEVYSNADPYGGAYYYRFVTELPDLAAWRIGLDLTSPEDADIYIRQNSLPYTNSLNQAFTDRSIRSGDDGFTRYLSPTTGAGQEWYFVVTAEDNATWNLYSGDVYARDLGILAPGTGSESGVSAVIPPETIRYFKTVMPSEAKGWRLWLQNSAGTTTWNRPFYVQKTYAPHPSSTSYYNYMRTGQWLFVPPYVEPGSPTSYFVGVPGSPNETFRLDSRQQAITDTTFNNTLTGESQSGFLFKTYHIPVPPEQIAWEVTVTPDNGTNPDVAVRLGLVPNPLNNDAFSEIDSTTVNDATTLVPPTLSDGSFYVTVYGDSAFEFNIRNREPIITEIDFISSTTNEIPDHVGWRYFKVSDIDQQLGQLGWLLQLRDHVPGSEIAIRRNYVPGRWNYRQNETVTVRQTSHNDQSSTLGFLQDPDHEADIWYVGVYYPGAPLGSFILDSGSHQPTVFSFDGHTNASVQLPPQSYSFYYVTLPAQTNGQDVIGWELRMNEWSGERPTMYIRRDQLPAVSGVQSWYYPWTYATWPSGLQWGNSNGDWSGYTYDPGGQIYPQPLLSMAMGAPLEPGSYYVAFYNSSSTVTGSYSFVSSAIGSGLTYDPQSIAFNGGSAAIDNLPARDVKYFKVTVPANTPSWNIRLENTAGESQLYIREGRVPTWQMGSGDTTSPGYSFSSMTRLKKTGDELFTLLPESGQTFIPAGDYYLMVVSEGQGPSGSTIGTGTCSATLHSLGSAPVTAMGTILPGGTLSQSGSYVTGEVDLFRFEVGANVPAFEVRLKNTTGTPTYYLRSDDTLPRGPGYGIYSGTGYEFTDTQITTHANPGTGTWSVVVGQAGNPAPGSYTLEVRAVDSTEFVFDGGGKSAELLPPEEWVYYHVDVPSQVDGQDVIGWELRMTEWSGARPTMYIRRDLLPASYGVAGWYYPWSYATWPSGQQWGNSGSDWSGYYYDPDSQTYPQSLLSMAMGAPLEPGSYYVGFYNSSQTVTGSFSFASSAIGAGMTYEPTIVPFNGGSANITALPARGVEYFKVTVPPNMPSWRVQLENVSGETKLYIREARVPTWSMGANPTYSPGASFSSMTALQISGDEHFTLLPESGQTTIPSGDYYLMVVSEGQSPSGSTIGTGTASAILRSHGEAVINDIGVVNNPGTTTQADSYAKGEIRRYRFTVPAGVQTMQIRLDDRVGSPEMNLRLDTNFPNGTSYGSYSGYNRDFYNTSIINITEPAPGTWSLMVNDSRNASSIEAGSYTLRIVTTGTTDIAFDGGGDSGAALPPTSWKYYKVEVPEQVNGQDVIGWELRTTQWSGNRPTMYIRRDELPASTGVSDWYYPWTYASWPSGFQWGTSSGDWSQRTYSSNGTITYPEYLLSMGMGAPLEPGTYYIGFYNSSTSVTGSFSFVSSAIGSGMTYDPQPIAFNGGSAAVNSLPARDVQYFKVDVPADQTNWKIKLENTVGETALYIRESFVPTWSMYQDGQYSPGATFSYIPRLDKADNEHYVLLPESGATTIPAGTYYLMVVSQGVNPTSSWIGTGSSSAVLRSLGEQVVPNLGDVPPGGSVSVSDTYEAGEADNLFRFNVTTNAGAVELQLMDIAVGNPRFYLRKDGNLPDGPNYGLYSGYADTHYNDAVFTVPNPGTGIWSVVVADPDQENNLQNGEYRLQITQKLPVDLNFDALLNTNGNSNVAGGTLANNQRDFYRVVVPAEIGGEPVVGWYLTSATSQGAAEVRVRQNLLPDDAGGGSTQTPFDSPAQVVVPTMLTPGRWYVEVKGGGATSYTLTSSAIKTERDWTMPAVGEAITTPGLSVPLFGDSGVNDAGLPLPVDQGVDLESGFYHFYSVTVPEDNAGLLRTQLEAISGNPNLYIRIGNAPTLDYSVSYRAQYDHRLDSTANTEYGSWVPYDGRTEDALAAGTWYLMVKAEGASNARYRLKLSGGNAYVGGNVQDLALNGGNLTGQLLADNDWRHYRVVVPTDAPVNWNITYTQVSGNVDLFIRDTVPVGNSGTYSESTSYIRDWNNDQKNRGTARPNFLNTGSYTLNVPPLRPGHVYYLSFIAKADASFSVSSSVSGGTIPVYPKVDFEDGFVSTTIPAGATVTYQVDVPPDAVRWIHSTTNTSALNVYLEQGALPSQTTSDHAYWTNGNGSRNQYLLNANGWPWRPNYTYYFTIVNPGATPEPFDLVMRGSKVAEIPQNLSAYDGTYDDYIRINWSSVSGVSNYELWRNTVDDKATATNLVSGLTSSSYYDYSAVPGKLYYYWASVGGVTNTAWFSNGDSGWRPGTGTITPSQRTHSAAGGSGTVDVAASGDTLWTAKESLSWVTINSGSSGTNNGTVAYTVSVYAGENARTGTVSVAGQAFSVIQSAFGVPSNVQATDGTFSDRTEVTWDVLPGATRYYLYRNEVNDTVGATYLGYVTTNFYSDISGILNRTYYYFVRPYNSGGQGGYSLPDSGYRDSGIISGDWISTHFPGGYPGDGVDSDGDGFSNLEEFIADTIPTDGLSYFRIEDQYGAPAGFIIEWTPISGRVYSVRWTDSLPALPSVLTHGLTYPQGSYTDTVHTVIGEGFYSLEVEME